MNKLDKMNNETEVDLLGKLDTKLSKYLSLKDGLINNDYVEVFGDAFKVLKLISSTSQLISKKKLAYFLKGLSYNQEPTDVQLHKLYEYINSEQKAEFISESVIKVFNSNSKKASYLIGLLIHGLINSNVNITYKELVCANALSTFFDYDLDNIIILNKYIKYLNNKRNNVWFNFGFSLKKWCNNNDIKIDDSVALTVQKCVSSQILTEDIEVDLDIDEDTVGFSSVDSSVSYKFTTAGCLLLNNLKYLEKL